MSDKKPDNYQDTVAKKNEPTQALSGRDKSQKMLQQIN